MVRRYIVGIDIGGTFTDIILYDTRDNKIKHLKILTDPKKPDYTFIKALESLGIELEEVEMIIHGTTLGTNMLLGQTGLEKPETILITNKGFTDVIEIGRQNRPELYNIFFEKPPPLIPRNKRIGIRGRIDARGNIIEELDLDEVNQVLSNYCGEAESIVISLLNSYRNPIHEETVLKIAHEKYPEKYVTIGSKVDPRPGEYERTTSAVLNGMLKPIVSKYLKSIWSILKEKGFKGDFHIMASHGGVVNVEEAIEKPVQLIESGPAAGAIAAALQAKILDEKYVIALDMGGTTSKATALIDGEPLLTTEYEVGGKVHMGRIVKGSGYPLRMPHVDIAEIGVGGGSIIWIDRGGQLRVGPISAGADPGPACYGKGGFEPTLTDAYLLLGWIPDKLGGGEITLSKEKAYKAFEKLSTKYGGDVYEIAYRAIEIANEHLHRAISIVSIERGYDISNFIIILFGGAAPIHSTFLVELGFRHALIPPYAGVFTAYGLINTDHKYIVQRGVGRYADRKTDEYLNNLYLEMLNEVRDKIPLNNGETHYIECMLEMKYRRQGSTLLIPYKNSLKEAVKTFREVYRERYGYLMDEKPYIETIILQVKILNRGWGWPKCMPAEMYIPEPIKTRKAFFNGEWMEANIYVREELKPGASLEGPSIIESIDTTVVIRPGYRAYVDAYGSIAVHKVGE